MIGPGERHGTSRFGTKARTKDQEAAMVGGSKTKDGAKVGSSKK